MASDAMIRSSNGPAVMIWREPSTDEMVKLTSTSPGLGAPERIGTVSGGVNLAVGKRDRLIHSAHVHAHGRRRRVRSQLNLQLAAVVATRQNHGGYAVLLPDHLSWRRWRRLN